jgi:predicted metal-dependent phosphoesterase TrpH
MRIRGAIHAHSTLSRDGTLSLAELRSFFLSKGMQFLAVSEHAEDMNEEKVQRLIEQCQKNSDEQFCLIPGLEFVCDGDVHIPGLGMKRLLEVTDPAKVISEIRGDGGFTVLAHPVRMKWRLPETAIRAVNSAEIWNVGYDGKFLPSAEAFQWFKKARAINPELLAVASLDFHKKAAFCDVAIEVEPASMSPQGILDCLRAGLYRIRTPFFNAEPHGSIPGVQAALIGMASRQLKSLRRLRTRFAGR